MDWLPYALLSAVFAAAVAILGKIGVKGIDSNLATAIRTVVILLFAWGIVAAQGTYRQIGSLPPKTIVFLVLSGIATGMSWLFYFRALQLGNASQVAPIDKLSVVITFVMAALILKEKITLPIALGTILIASGSLVIALWR
jgi:transporter family protein